MLEHIVLAEIKAYLRQNISQEQMQQSMRKQHEDSIEAYKTESADCEKCQEQIKIQNRQNYEAMRTLPREQISAFMTQGSASLYGLPALG